MALLLSILLAMCGLEGSKEARAERPRTVSRTCPPRFDYDGCRRSLRRVAWESLGHDLALLQPALGREAAVTSGLRREHTGTCSSGSGTATASTTQLRRMVRAHIERLAGSGLSGTGAHGVFTHPAVLVNAIHFTLREARCPLTRQQEDELFLLGRQYVDEERVRVREARHEPLALARLIRECQLRDRLLDWASATLTPGQQDVLLPAATQDLVGWSYFSGSAVLAPQAYPVAYVEKAQLVDALLRWHVGRFGFGRRDLPIVRSHLERFVASLPDEPASQKAGVLSVRYTTDVAQKTAELRNALLDVGSFTWAQRDRLRREQRFCVPVRIAAPTVGD